MAEVKNSALLKLLLDHSREVVREAGAQLTAERYLLTVIEVLDGTFPIEGEQPFTQFQNRAEQERVNLQALKTVLIDYISEGKRIFQDSMYLSKKLIEARAEAASAHEETLSPELLLACILREPSSIIEKGLKECSGSAGKAAPEPAGESGESTEASEESGEPISVDALLKQSSSISLAGLNLGGSGEKPADKPAEKPAPTKEAPEQSGKFSLDELVQKQKLQGSAPEQPEEQPLSMDELTRQTKSLRAKLLQTVFGQDHAVNLFAKGYFQGQMLAMMDKTRIRPRATYLFAGPPGVGKTLLAEKAAEALGLPFMRFDMSEYSDKEANTEFAGSDKVYKGAQEGNVTGFVAKNPRCVLLFDEIEKAHLVVIHLFLQLLDAGRLRDSYTDKEVSFKDTIIFFTTNAGRQLYEENETGNYAMLTRKVILKALETDINPVTGGAFFPAAILSRFASGNVVMFNHISAYNLCKIAKKEILRQAKNFTEASGIDIRIDETVYPALLFGEGGAADARAVRARAESFFHSEIFELLRLVSSDTRKTGVSDIEQISFDVMLPENRPEVLRLFTQDEKPQILLFAGEEALAFCRENAPQCEFVCAESVEAAKELLKHNPIELVLLDMTVGLRENTEQFLNIEDIASDSRDFYRFLLAADPSMPVYLLEHEERPFSAEETETFQQQGVRDIIPMRAEAFSSRIETICRQMHQQAGMLELARSSKAVSFETGQSVSEDGKKARIRLFDFGLRVAVDAEDQANVLSAVSRPDVKFDEVIGAEDAKKELRYFVQYLRNPKKYLGTGVAAPRGVLLYGPPGTGKTMLAKAMAAESDVTFIAAEGNQFLKKYVGEGPELVHKIFRTARKYAPSILFVDEIDTFARKRTGGEQTHAAEEILTAFLAEMDGFKKDPTKPVFVLAATNYDADESSRKGLDGAIMRRFDRRVYIDLPKKDDRIQFIRMKLAANSAFRISDQQIDNLTVRSTGMSLAQLESVFELALRSAIREGSTVVTDAVLEEAFETFVSGDVKKWNPETLERVARHEAGHTFLCWQSGENPSYVTIVARGNHGGYMQHDDHEDQPISTRENLLARIRTALGGRAAELCYYGNEDGISTGASGDLDTATRVAQSMLCYYGMTDEFGLAVVDPDRQSGNALAPAVHDAVNRILSEQMDQAVSLIRENKEAVDALVDALIQHDHLTGDEIGRILSAHAVRREPANV
ncbi:MAG: AAA family ATPase [Oscillospiraceae bacterium]|nr:AAA family ATPase [Oscillospiraceae bacterium]